MEAHRILCAERSLGIHWGTFQLADDQYDEPVIELEKALAQQPGLPPFEAIENGAAIALS